MPFEAGPGGRRGARNTHVADEAHEGARPSRAVVEVVGAGVELGGRRVLDDVSLEVAAGEIVTLLGPNGAGKSTLSRVISGQIGVQRGDVRVDGRDPYRSRRARTAIGLVPQQIALYERLTPGENLVAFGAIMGVQRRHRLARARRLLERVGLSARIDDPVRSLSGGMQRRVNIAVALMHQPILLVLDEPTVGLDAAAQAGIVELLRSLKGDGTAILLVTHDLAEAQLLADRLAVMVGGRVRFSGALEDVVEREFANVRQVRLINPRLDGGSLGDGARLMQASGFAPNGEAGGWAAVLSADDPRLAHLWLLIAEDRLSVDHVSVSRADLALLLARATGQAGAWA